MSTQLGDPLPRAGYMRGYVYEIQYHELGEQGRAGDRTKFRSLMASTRRLFTPWPDPRPVIQALESLIVAESRKNTEAFIADCGDPNEASIHLIQAIEVVSATRVSSVDAIFGFDFAPSYAPVPPTVVGVAP